MKHLTEEELIEHYYLEDFYKAEAELHLQVCRQCAQAYENLGRLLGSVRAPEAPARNAEYGAQVWQSIQGSLQPYSQKKKRFSFFWRQLAYAAACLLVLAGAFFAGRKWEHAHTSSIAANVEPKAKERVVLFVLDNHLDRSERLLVQLKHASADGAEIDQPLQSEARQLLTDNRLYRQSAAHANDPLLNATLDHLQRVLLEVANSPDGLNAADLARIEKEMNTQNLLFQIRILRTKVAGQGTNAQAARKGASI